MTYFRLSINFFGFLLILISSCAYAQSPITISKDTITFNLQKVAGLGPLGNTSVSIGSYDQYKDAEEFKAYPVMKNIPGGLTGIVQYLYILNGFQFSFQNYVSGIYSKTFFISKCAEQHWKLADTINLSRKPLLCSFAVLAGVDSLKNNMVIIDANNNGDFADDVIKPLLKNAYEEDQINRLAIPVKTTFLAGKKIKQKDVLVFLSKSHNPQELELSFAFPEFAYAKFNYKGEAYIMCAGIEFKSSYMCILRDRPYFTSVNQGNIIRPNHFVKIGNSSFKFVNYDDNENKLSLTGSALDAFSDYMGNVETPKSVLLQTTDTTVSDQVGFMAPAIIGNNINQHLSKGVAISSASLKGKYIFVDFWSTYCGPCIEELPYLRDAYEKYNRNKFEIIGVFDERAKNITEKLFTTNKVTWPNIRMDDKTTQVSGYGHIISFPTNYLIDPTGRIIAYNLRGDELINQLKVLLN